jgi:hypothetical protein
MVPTEEEEEGKGEESENSRTEQNGRQDKI